MRFLPALVTLAVLTGCATPYQQKGFRGGFSETRLESNVFRVTFRGNGYTSEERAADYALLRSAELALENGFGYFVITDKSMGSSTSSAAAPTWSEYLSYSGDRDGYASSSYTDTIVCFQSRPEMATVYDAASLRDSLAQKYGLTLKQASGS